MTSLDHETPLTAVPPATSLLGALREQSQQLANEQTIDIPITGWHPIELVARYRFVDAERGHEIGKQIRDDARYTDDTQRAEAGLIAVMVEACTGIYAREGDKLEPVDPDGAGAPCGYDDRLETFLHDAYGWEPTGTARGAVVLAFKGNWIAAVNHGRTLAEWMADTSKTIEQLLGEA